MNPGMIFTDVLVRPIITALVGIYQILVFLHIPSPLGFSIILLTVFIRFLLYPLTASQLKASKKMQTIAPHISKLKEKHGKDAKRLQEETMKLYKEHGVNPALGCLPMLVQLPVIWALYSVFQSVVRLSPEKLVAYINSSVYIENLRLHHLLDQRFFSIPLVQTPSHLVNILGPLIFLVPFLTGVFQLIQSKMMLAKALPQEKKLPTTTKELLKGSGEKEKKEDDFATAFQSQSLYMFPAMIAFFSYSFPIGLSLYWNTLTIFGILQQYRIAGAGGLSDWIEKGQDIWTKNRKKL